jgi:ATP-binding protein involved in chromosome partitioning
MIQTSGVSGEPKALLNCSHNFGGLGDGAKTMVNEKDVLKVLSQVEEPELHRDLVSLNMIKDITVDDGKVSFTIILTTPACPLTETIEKQAKEAVE